MLAEECPIHRDLKEALLTATELDTDIIMRPVGFAHRVWLNDPAKKVMELEEKKAEFSEIYPFVSGESAKKMYDTGDINAGTVSCSQGIGLIKKIQPLKEIFAEMTAEAKQIYESMGK